MSVHIIPIGSDNYSYVIADGGVAAVVDPGEAGPVEKFLNAHRLELQVVLLTHMHGDHTGGALRLKSTLGGKVAGPGGAGVDRPVHDGDVLPAGSLKIRAIATPGHTSGDISYHVPELDAVFTGDTMFVCGCGRLFGGNAATMWNSLNRIVSLGDSTLVYCGHEYTEENLEFAHSVEPNNEAVKQRLAEVKAMRRQNAPTVPSLIASEKQTNPFLRASDPVMKQALGMATASDVELFAELRKRKDRF